MAAAGRAWLAERGVPPSCQRVGFHSVASMQPLHMHAMSDDLGAPGMKTKKHYLSYLPPFFVAAEDVAACLEAGRPPPYLSPDEASVALKAPLACQYCRVVLASMATLKDHMAACAVAHGRDWWVARGAAGAGAGG